MSDYAERAGMKVDRRLVDFIEREALQGLDIEAGAFWQGADDIFARFTPENRELLATRDRMQAAIDDWHRERAGRAIDQIEYQAFLTDLGYLEPEPAPFEIDTANVDPEVAEIAGPQLVVPVLNDRFVLNAANARWGSLYDALYGTDALDAPPPRPGGYDPERGAHVVRQAKQLLDEMVPLAEGSWVYFEKPWENDIVLADERQYVGRSKWGRLFRHNGLHIEVVFDRDDPIGRDDPAGVADILLESALTTIVDFEDSVAAVDAEDKVTGYRHWLGLMRGDLEARFEKDGEVITRKLEPDREYDPVNPEPVEGRLSDEEGASTGPALSNRFTLPGRSLLFCRNVGHLMTTPTVLLEEGSEASEGILDAIVTSLIALQDLRGLGRYRNSRAGSVYIVKPKMHGSAEAEFADRLFDAVEDLLGLDRYTLKIGLMDEERRTSANLAACIHALRHRIVFINTGFLDRTGDEIHTSMEAGPMLRKGAMKEADWIQAYEDRNVRIGLACGFSGKAQIGKGMWPAPDRMAEMMEAKVGHPRSGANTAWVPSPTAATLHAIHYHRCDVFKRQRAITGEPVPPLDKLLGAPVTEGRNWSAEEIREELDNNAQGILGYVVRWIDQGVGCSKVPDIHDVGLMEDRATLRISSQHMANWLRHGVCNEADVNAAFERMAAKVDAQNAGDPDYRPMAGNPDSLALRTARALVFKGAQQPNGYTEPLLHRFRRRAKAG